MNTPIHRIALLFLFAAMSGHATAQCANKVLHTSGTQTVGGVSVTVTKLGHASIDTTYCPSTRPYYVGDLSSGPAGVFEHKPSTGSG